MIYMMWPTPNNGYGGRHLLRIWEKVRRDCANRENPLKLVGHSTDSAGFSLSAFVTLMTPTKETVANGIFYLGLCIPDERYIAPYFWTLPSISYPDYDHLRRTLLRNLKYETYELTMYKDTDGALVATINHLHELMEICTKQGETVPFSAQDLVLINFFDQRPDTANRIFSLRVAEMLESHVKGSAATCLFITAVYHLTEPFFKADFGTPEDIQRSVSTGITIFRLWRKYLEMKKLRLNALAHAAKCKDKRGHFLTYGAYTTAELIFSAASLHCLAMFLHFKEFGPSLCSPHRSGTISTEKIIGQLQGKTTNIQSLDTSPTFGDMLNRSKDLQFITEGLTDLSACEGVKIPSTSNRKTSHFNKQRPPASRSYKYPNSYQEFLQKQQDMHREGVKKAQDLIRKFLPTEFSRLLESNNLWDCPYYFQKPTNIQMIRSGPPPPECNKLSMSLAECPDTEVIINTVECNTANEIKDVAPESQEHSVTDSEGDDISQDVCDECEEVSDSDTEDGTMAESTPVTRKWYLKKGESELHISRALKLLLPREYIAKERSRRHWVGKSLIQAWKEIDGSHDVIRFRDIAVKVKGATVFMHILSIQSDEGKEQISASSKTKGTIRGRPYVEIGDNRYDVSHRTLLTRWIPLSKVLCEVEMLKNNDGTCSLSEDSKAKLQSMEKKLDSQIPFASAVDGAGDDYYEVEKVLEVRINRKFHSEEYKVRFKGYSSEDDMWLPSSAFKESVTFQTVSQRGRIRTHRMKQDTSSEHLTDINSLSETSGPSRKRKRPTKNNNKGKFLHYFCPRMASPCITV